MPIPADELDRFLAELERLDIDDLGMIALPEPDQDARRELLGRAVAAAEAAGPERVAVLRAAPVRARELLIDAFARRGFEPTWAGVNWGRSIGRTDDRMRLLLAAEDAAVAAVVGDLLDEDDVAALRERFDLAASMTGTAANLRFPVEGGPGARGAVTGASVVTLLAGIGPALIAAGVGIVALLRRGRRRDDREA
jgi:hypothetical protein